MRSICALFFLTFSSPYLALAQTVDPEMIPGHAVSGGRRGDNLKHSLEARRIGLRHDGLREQLQGSFFSARAHNSSHGQYVELETVRSDRIFAIIVEFGDERHPLYPGGTDGPLHNQIEEPDRAIDNTTIWQADYDRAHYQDMYFNKMRNYYRAASSGRYDFTGHVTDWVRVPYNEARYGRSLCGTTICSNVWQIVADGVDAWYAAEIAAGRGAAELAAKLATFDRWDRYDFDGDGDFDEPDGYIDHFQIVHAGIGEETGGGAQGEDAIWSHRWYVNTHLIGAEGPSGNLLGGAQIGGSGMWVGDYTIQPENGGLGVFAHEYGHDLGLPDAYDTTNLADNSTAFWTIMSVGAYMGNGTVDIGSRPVDFTAWEKYALGWLNYELAFSDSHSSHRLGPAEFNTRAAQGLFVILPDRERVIPLEAPFEGALAWWSGAGNNLDQTMTRSITVPAPGGELTMQLAWDIEEHWDYGYVSVSTDDGASWTNLAGNVTTNEDPNGHNFGNGITGSSGGWVLASFDLSAYAGSTILLQLRYWTDPLAQESGLQADDIRIAGEFIDGAESGENGWTLNGFTASNGIESQFTFNAYVAEYRQYLNYDTGLKTGPFNFPEDSAPNWVEHYSYLPGLLISYWDYYHGENDVSYHPGEGMILPIDARSTPVFRADLPDVPWAARFQMYDATFGLAPSTSMTLHRNGVATTFPAGPAEPVFDDRILHWDSRAPYSSVRHPSTGTEVRVVSQNAHDGFMQVHVGPAQ
jgi:immune inhibitor A